MPNITLKNIPDDLYAALKKSAELNRRSLNSEILVCIEKTLVKEIPNVELVLETARLLREKTKKLKVAAIAISRTKKRIKK
jgi:plasmid stability protein